MLYNTYDLEITAGAAERMRGDILSRLAIAAEFGVDVYSDGDPRVAERVMGAVLFGNERPPRLRRNAWTITGDRLVEGFTLTHPALVALVERIRAWTIHSKVVTKQAANGEVEREMESTAVTEEVTVGGTTYTLGDAQQ